MKKLLVLSLSAILMAGCSKQRATYQEALAERFAEDQDVKDYQLDPEDLAACVLNEVDAQLPGFRGSSVRDRYYIAYTNFIKVHDPQEAEESLEKAAKLFGSKKAARTAAVQITTHTMYCMGKLLDRKNRIDRLFSRNEEGEEQPGE